MRIIKRLKKLLGLEKEAEVEKLTKVPSEVREAIPDEYRDFKHFEGYRIKTKEGKPRKAVHQDIGRFMKHGRQAPWYRKSVKAKIQPEDEK